VKNIKPRTLKGFRDFLPEKAKKRQWLIGELRSVFESYGFAPLETPALEYAEILKGKYGEEEKLIYEFETKGKDKVALRYDQTVPLARVIAQYENELVFPFKRYQIQNVWRGENPQKGRYREFTQCDADIIGSSSSLSDAEILMLALNIYKKLGLSVRIKINDRKNLESLERKYISAIDKIEKIGESGVLKELAEKGLNDEAAKKALSDLQSKPKTQRIEEILVSLEKMGADTNLIDYEPTLARGLDYYTGMIFEIVSENYQGSLCSGGRYDKLIGTFSEKEIPAVGFGLGFDRTLEALEQNNLIPKDQNNSKVLVTIFSKDLLDASLETLNELRSNNISSEIYLDSEAPIDKQLKYADKKNMPYSILIGPKEAEENKLTLKDMKTGEQDTLALEEVIKLLSGNRTQYLI
jgi:histidyl-tRNA synthetase